MLKIFKQTTKFSQKRYLNIHEYQSHELMRKYNIGVPNGCVATTVQEAMEGGKKIFDNKRDCVVKAQVLAGGRGKGTFENGFKGGVHMAVTEEKLKYFAEKMLGQKLVTKQTGGEGKLVSKIYIQERLYARRELYFAILLDRSYNGPVMVASQRGGMNIEDVAKETPEEIFKIPININIGMTEEQAIEMAKNLGFENNTINIAAQEFLKLYKLFIDNDNTLIEINPLMETPDFQVICADAKLNFDDNSDYKHEELFKLKDETQEDSREVAARKFNLSYIGLDGNIGCIVNGAGLAMATMDIIKLFGGSPANFLDVGGGASQEQLAEALKILNSDPKVQAILVNIFGGIMRCDLVAKGIIHAAKETKLRVPLIVRLQGTNFKEAKQIMDASDMKVIPADDLETAAEKAVQMANIMKMANDIDVKVSFELPI
eukprot:gene2857-4700_t